MKNIFAAIKDREVKDIYEATQLLLQETCPESFPSAEMETFEQQIQAQRERIDFDKISAMAQKYNVVFWEDSAWLVGQLAVFDKRNKEVVDEVSALDKKTYKDSCYRLEVLKVVKMLTSDMSYLSIKGEQPVRMAYPILSEYLPIVLLQKLFDDNKIFYCSHMGWDFDNPPSVSLDNLEKFTSIEEEMVKSYELMNKRSDSNIALEVYHFVSIFRQIEFWEQSYKNGEYVFDVEQKTMKGWAVTKKACFVVEALVFYGILPQRLLTKDNKDKYDFVKNKIDQAVRFLEVVR